MATTFLYTFPQWIVFVALFSIVYGWVEDKKEFRLIGFLVIICLGLFSVYVITGDHLAPGQHLTADELMQKKLTDGTTREVPIEKQLLPAYLTFMVSSVMALVATILDWLNKKQYRLFSILAGLVVLIGFFIIVGAVHSAS